MDIQRRHAPQQLLGFNLWFAKEGINKYPCTVRVAHIQWNVFYSIPLFVQELFSPEQSESTSEILPFTALLVVFL